MESMRRKEREMGGLGEGCETVRVVMTRKWSDGVAGEQVMTGCNAD